MPTPLVRRAAAVVALALLAAGLTGCATAAAGADRGSVLITRGGATTVERNGAVVEAKGRALTVQADAADVTVVCAGGERIGVLARSGTLTLQGSCGDVELTADTQVVIAAGIAALAVNGRRNTVTATTLASLTVTGADNTVTYGSVKQAPEMVGVRNVVGDAG